MSLSSMLAVVARVCLASIARAVARDQNVRTSQEFLVLVAANCFCWMAAVVYVLSALLRELVSDFVCV